MRISNLKLVGVSACLFIIIAVTIYGFSRDDRSDHTLPKSDNPIQQVENQNESTQLPTYMNVTLSSSERAHLLLAEMTLQEKIGQMVQAEVASTTLDDIQNHYIGSILSAGGSGPASNNPEAWMNLYDRYQEQALLTRLQIPILYGIDAVHGHNNVYGATIFPHNIGLGATRDVELVRSIGEIVASEVRATGINWTFAPTLAVPLNERWGRTYEGFSENPQLVAKLGKAMVLGLQGSPFEDDYLGPGKVLSTVKHWIGDGATTDGIDRGNAQLTEEQLNKFIYPYREAIEAGARTVMISYSSWNGEKLHGNSYLIQDKLKGELGFSGIVISDLNGIHEISPNFNDAVRTSVNAGIDMFMMSDNWIGFIDNLTAMVQQGEVSQDRIDDAVTRILTVKFETGIFEQPYGDRSKLEENLLGSDEHRKVAREAVRKSLVLLKNDNDVLPISKDVKRVFVAGPKANNIGFQSGGWTISWQGSEGDITPGTTILQGIQQAVSEHTEVSYVPTGVGAGGHDVAIVVVGEEPYAENGGDREELVLNRSDLATLEAVEQSGVPMVVIMTSGRPLIISEQLASWDAFIAAWLPGTEGDGIADVIFGDYDFTGRLPITWPKSMEQIPIQYDDTDIQPLFPYGFGLSQNRNTTKVIQSWEDFDASNLPLLSAIFDREIYLYADKKDGVSLYIGNNEHHYDWTYMTPRFILPRMHVDDYDDDGNDELAVILNIGSGTGISIEELHIIEISEEMNNTGNYEDFKPNDFLPQLHDAVSFITSIKDEELMGEITVGAQTYTESLKAYQTEEAGKVNQELVFGNIVSYKVEGNKLIAQFGVEITTENFVSPQYIGVIQAEVKYAAGEFNISNLRFANHLE